MFATAAAGLVEVLAEAIATEACGAGGAVIDRALLAARDQLFRARHDHDPDPARVADISVMDALEHLARVALDAMDPVTAAGRPSRPSPPDHRAATPPPRPPPPACLTGWANHSGERADWRWLIWDDHTDQGGSV